ncbi:MAG TPA: hypothetical protein VH396_19195 [Chitinophagaceae bacterium]|jgi:hypothetical protein
MKKIFTLLFSLSILGSAFAQSQCIYPGPADHAIVISNKYHRYVETYSFTRHERDLQLTKVNQTYNAMLKGVINMRVLSPAEKLKLIRMIENNRDEKVKAIHARFNDQRNKFNDRYYDEHFNWRG